MKFKNIIIFCLAIIVGVGFAFFVYYQYDEKEPIQFVFNETELSETLSFLQFGVYSSLESMEQNTTSLIDYIYEEKEGRYYVYVGMTGNEENVNKIKGIFEKKGYILYRKDITVKGTSFLKVLKEYDEKIKNEEEESKVLLLLRNVLEQYKELVLDVENERTS